MGHGGLDTADAPEVPAGLQPPQSSGGVGARQARRDLAEPRTLFLRWFWLVYLPIGLLFLAILLSLVGLLPSWALIPAVADGCWVAASVRLLMERHRRGLKVPSPRAVLVSVGVETALLGLGVGMVWAAAGRLSSSGGPTLFFGGIFFLILAFTAPAMRVADLALRSATRLARMLLRAASDSSSAGPRRIRSRRKAT